MRCCAAGPALVFFALVFALFLGTLQMDAKPYLTMYVLDTDGNIERQVNTQMPASGGLCMCLRVSACVCLICAGTTTRNVQKYSWVPSTVGYVRNIVCSQVLNRLFRHFCVDVHLKSLFPTYKSVNYFYLVNQRSPFIGALNRAPTPVPIVHRYYFFLTRRLLVPLLRYFCT